MLLKCCTQYASKSGKLIGGHRTGEGLFSFQSQIKAWQRIFKLPYICTHLTHEQRNAQNSPRQTSTVHKLRTSRCSSWILKRQRNQRSNCQHLLDHQKSKRVPKKHQLLLWTSLVAQTVKRLPIMQETQIQSLGQENLLEKEMATHSSIFAWRILWTEEPGVLLSMGSHKVRHD